MTDEDRIAHLMGEPAGSLDDVDEAALDDLRDLLRDPSVWAAPPSDLGDRVVASIAAEAGAVPAPAQLRDRRRRRPWIAAALAAAAVVAGVLVAGSVLSD